MKTGGGLGIVSVLDDGQPDGRSAIRSVRRGFAELRHALFLSRVLENMRFEAEGVNYGCVSRGFAA
jgi:hypothetical protein